jgi:hypothetical protein
MKYSRSSLVPPLLIVYLLLVTLERSYGFLVMNPLSSFNTPQTTLNPVPIYSKYLWNSNFSVVNASLVDIFKDRSLFDYCDLNNYNAKAFEPLLNQYSVLNGFNISDNWIAYTRDSFNVISECKPPTNQEKHVLYQRELFLTFYLQDAGARGFINTQSG